MCSVRLSELTSHAGRLHCGNWWPGLLKTRRAPAVTRRHLSYRSSRWCSCVCPSGYCVRRYVRRVVRPSVGGLISRSGGRSRVKNTDAEQLRAWLPIITCSDRADRPGRSVVDRMLDHAHTDRPSPRLLLSLFLAASTSTAIIADRTHSAGSDTDT